MNELEVTLYNKINSTYIENVNIKDIMTKDCYRDIDKLYGSGVNNDNYEFTDFTNKWSILIHKDIFESLINDIFNFVDINIYWFDFLVKYGLINYDKSSDKSYNIFSDYDSNKVNTDDFKHINSKEFSKNSGIIVQHSYIKQMEFNFALNEINSYKEEGNYEEYTWGIMSLFYIHYFQ